MQPLGRHLGKFYPDYIIRGISDINPLDLDGISAIFFDYDNSVAGFGEEIKDPERKALERLGEAGIKPFVVTNAHASRINTIRDNRLRQRWLEILAVFMKLSRIWKLRAA